MEAVRDDQPFNYPFLFTSQRGRLAVRLATAHCRTVTAYCQTVPIMNTYFFCDRVSDSTGTQLTVHRRPIVVQQSVRLKATLAYLSVEFFHLHPIIPTSTRVDTYPTASTLRLHIQPTRRLHVFFPMLQHSNGPDPALC